MSGDKKAQTSCLDYLGFASMIFILIGSLNWGVVGVRYMFNFSLPDMINATAADGTLVTMEAHERVFIPDLLQLFTGKTAGIEPLQSTVYWLVFLSGLLYLGLFIYNSVEVRTEKA